MVGAALLRPEEAEAMTVKRVAIYTRQSVADDLEFGSLQAQRQSVEAYVASQPGWTALTERYDDHGFSGGTTDRPAFQRLLADVKAGRVDIVAAYKLDRLSRSILDFSSILDLFDRHGVAFVSTTQQIDTSSSMGKLMQNIMASFAEFERQVISERTRDKMAATRRRGEWTGGNVPLGYDVVEKKLIVNEREAERVRGLFDEYLRIQSPTAVAQEANRRGWRTKTGRKFDAPAIRRIIANRLYIGEVCYHGKEIIPGVHDAIVERAIWDAAQQVQVKRPSSKPRNRWSAELAGLLKCGRCGGAYIHTHTGRGSTRRRYYACSTLQKQGAAACPGSRVSAPDVERLVVEQIRTIGQNPELLREVLAAVEHEVESGETTQRVQALEADRKAAKKRRTSLLRSIERGDASEATLDALTKVEDELQRLTRSVAEARGEQSFIEGAGLDAPDLQRMLSDFDPLWESMTTHERGELLSELLDAVVYDSATDEIELKLRPTGRKYLEVPA